MNFRRNFKEPSIYRVVCPISNGPLCLINNEILTFPSDKFFIVVSLLKWFAYYATKTIK